MQQQPVGWGIMSRRHESLDALLLAETLAMRLCHDIAGQVNAITGAVEVLRDEDGADPEALALAGEAGALLARRVRLARAAWGPAGVPMGLEEWRGLLEALPRRGVTLDLDGVEGGDFAPEAARLALNVLLLAGECLPAGGVIEVAGRPDQDIMVRLHGPRAAWPVGFAGILADPEAAWETLRAAEPARVARVLQGPLTALVAMAAGLRLSLLMGAQAEAAPPLLVGLAPRH